jgi:dihydrofolate reductase
MIVAAAENGVIGREGVLPWHLPADLRRFKRLTTGHAVIMGRRTWESIGGKALPGRRNIVLTRRRDYAAQGADVVHDLDEALARAEGEEVFICGGGGVYRAALPRAHRVYLTRVHAEPAGDATFPDLDPHHWRLTWEEKHEAPARDQPAFTFQTFERIRPASMDGVDREGYL